jgi:translocation and assembly module TamA
MHLHEKYISQLAIRRSAPLLAVLVFCIAFPVHAAAPSLKVVVEGVEGQQEKNVLAMLGIHNEQKDDGLTVPRLVALHRRAPDEIRAALAPFGLYRVVVEDELTKPESAGGRWVATYRIDPGEPVKVSSVDYRITGPGSDNPAFPAEFPMQPGDVVLHANYDKAKADISAIASEQGYLDAKLLRHVVLIDPVAYDARVEFHLDTGPRWYLGQVSFEQDLLADDYLEKFVDFEPGDVYDPDTLLALQGKLIGMEYFSDVEIIPRKEDAGPDRQVPIEVVAERNKANKYRVGVGFATDLGPRFSLDYRRRYIGRRGHKLKSEVEISPVRQSVIAEYRIPFRNPVADYMMLRPEFYSIDTTSRKGDLFKFSFVHSVLTRRGWRRNIALDYRYEDYEVAAEESSENFNGLVPNISWSKVKADDPINTRNGFRIKYLVQGTSDGLLSQTSYLSGSINYKWIKSLGDRFRLIARTDLGATLADSVTDVPASQRFFAGGDNSLRGWSLDGLGPIDPQTGKVIGGRYLAVGSLEAQTPLRGALSGALFTDFGNAFDPDYDSDFEQSAGLGLRYATPIGPVRIDVAYALTKDDGGFRLHFGLGPDL